MFVRLSDGAVRISHACTQKPLLQYRYSSTCMHGRPVWRTFDWHFHPLYAPAATSVSFPLGLLEASFFEFTQKPARRLNVPAMFFFNVSDWCSCRVFSVIHFDKVRLSVKPKHRSRGLSHPCPAPCTEKWRHVSPSIARQWQSRR